MAPAIRDGSRDRLRRSFTLSDARVTIEVDRRPDWILEALETAFDLEPDGDAVPAFRVLRSPDHDWVAHLFTAGEARPWVGVSTPAELVEHLAPPVEELLARRAARPVLHAGVVHLGRPVVVTGPSKAGKSTFIAWLASQPGAGYVTDELAVIGDSYVAGFRRPLHLRPASPRPVLEGWERWPASRFELVIPPGWIRRSEGRPLLVVLDRRDDLPGASVEFETLTVAGLVRAAASNSFNLREPGPDRLTALVRLVSGVDGVRVRYREASVAGLRVAELEPTDRPPGGPSDPRPVHGRSGRAWTFDDSMLVQAGDRPELVSLSGRFTPDDRSTPLRLGADLLSQLDHAFGRSSW
jgi:hypothetical protein